MFVLLAIVTALLAVLLGAVCWTLFSVLRQNGRTLRRLESLEAAVGELREARPADRVFADPSLSRSRLNRDGLAPGSAAPDFRLPTLDGGEATLADYAGRWLLLLFSDPECAPCQALLPRLVCTAAIEVLVVSRGSVEANQAKLAEAGVSFRVALQHRWEISRLYAKFATPAAYLIDPHGRIASPAALGATAILDLIGDERRTYAGRDETARPAVH